MKIRITEVEATAEDLRQSNSLAEGLSNILRAAFQTKSIEDLEEEDEEDEAGD